MAGNEIDWHILFSNVAQERIDPVCGRGGWAADPQSRANGFQSPSSVIVELEIGGLFGLSRPEINVRLVPDFKVPAGDFIQSITLDKMLRKRPHQIVPTLVIFGRRHNRVIPERMNVLAEGELLWHEADFDERTYSVLEQRIVDLVDIRKVVDRIPLLVLVV